MLEGECEKMPGDNEIGFGFSEETNGHVDQQPNIAAVMKLMELQLRAMVIPIVKSIIGPMMQTMVRKVVKEEFERAEERFFTKERWKSQDDASTSKVRSLELQFLDKVSLPVYTGKEIKAEGGHFIRLALVDPDTGTFINSGPEASGKVEIVVQSEGAAQGDKNWNCEGPDASIREEERKGPFLSTNYLNLKEGFTVLDNIKFKNQAKWTKNCEVSLQARIVGNFKGIIVKEAKTETFLVRDCRTTFYEKHYPPSLSDDICRLENISRGGQLYKSLRKEKIKKVEDFVRLFHMNPQSLQAMLNISSEKFKAIVDHAQSCLTDEKLFLYQSTSCGNKVGVVVDIVGRLRGFLREHQYVTVDELSEDEMVAARKAVVLACEHWEDVQPFDEGLIANFVPQLPEAISTSNVPRVESPSCRNVGNSNAIDENDHPLLSTWSRLPSPVYSFDHTSYFDGFGCPLDNLDFLTQGINHPIHSRTACEDFIDNEQVQLFIFDRDHNLQIDNQGIQPRAHHGTVATGCGKAGSHDPSSVKARLRWRMAVVSLSKGTVTLGESRSKKKQRHY